MPRWVTSRWWANSSSWGRLWGAVWPMDTRSGTSRSSRVRANFGSSGMAARRRVVAIGGWMASTVPPSASISAPLNAESAMISAAAGTSWANSARPCAVRRAWSWESPSKNSLGVMLWYTRPNGPGRCSSQATVCSQPMVTWYSTRSSSATASGGRAARATTSSSTESSKAWAISREPAPRTSWRARAWLVTASPAGRTTGAGGRPSATGGDRVVLRAVQKPVELLDDLAEPIGGLGAVVVDLGQPGVVGDR